MKEFIVNEYITLKLEGKKTNIYVNGELFRQCRFLLIDIPIKEISSFDDIESIDEASERLEQREIDIPPEIEYWANCSNLQVWAENNYNTQLLHQNLAFSLLRQLAEIGDPQAKEVFKEAITKRYKSNHRPVQFYLIMQDYLNYFTHEEIERLVGEKFYIYRNDENMKKRHLLNILIANCLKEDQFDEAANILRQGFKISKSSHNFWNNIGMGYTKNKQFGKAIEAYKKALDIDPSNYKILNNLGLIYGEVNKFDNAIHYFIKALNILKDGDPEKFKNAISVNIERLNERIENFNAENNKNLPKYWK